MKKLLLVSILGLSACGGPVDLVSLDPNQAGVTSNEVDGKMVITGEAGSNYTESQIVDFLLVPECEIHGMKVESQNMTTNSDGSINISAVCA